MKRVLLWIGGMVLAPVALVLIVAVLLYVPCVQNWAVKHVARLASESVGMDISVDRVSLVFPFDLGVYGVRVVQPGNSLSSATDTIADMGSFVVNVRLRPLLRQQVVVDCLELSNVKVNTVDMVAMARITGNIGHLSVRSRNIDLATGVVNLNGARISDADISVELCDTVVPPDTASAAVPWKICLDRLDMERMDVAVHTAGDTISVKARLENLSVDNAIIDLLHGRYTVGSIALADGTVDYDNNMVPAAGGLDPNHIALSGVNIRIDSVLYCDSLTQLSLRNCSMKERSGLELSALEGPVMLDSMRLSLPQLTLRTPDSDLAVEAHIDLDVMDDEDPGHVELRLLASIGKQDIMRFAGDLPAQFAMAYPNRPLTVRGLVNGTVRDLNIVGFDVNLPTAFRVTASGTAANITDMERLRADIKVAVEADNISFVEAVAGPDAGFTLPRGINIDGRVGVAGATYRATLAAREGGGSVSFDGMFNASTEAYKATLAVEGLDAAHFVPQDSAITLSCKVSAEGHGFDFLSRNCRLDVAASVDSIAYGSLGVGGLTLGTSLRDGKAHVGLGSGNALLDADVIVDALLSRSRVQTSVVVDVRDIDLQRLNISENELSAGMCAQFDFETDLNQSYSLKGSVEDIRVDAHQQSFHPTDLNVDVFTSPDTTWAMVNSGNMDFQMTAKGGYENIMEQAELLIAEAERQQAEKIIDQNRLTRLLPYLSLRFVSGEGNPFANFLKAKGITFSDMAVNLRSSPKKGLTGNMHLYSLVADSTQIDTVLFHMTQDTVSRVRFVGKVKNDKDNPQLVFTALFNGYYYETEAGLSVKLFDAADSLGVHLGARAEMCDSGINVRLMPERPVLGYMGFNLNKDNYIFLGRDKRVRAQVDLIADDKTGVKIYSEGGDADALQDITMSVNKFDLGRITSALPFAPDVGGLLYGDFRVILDKDERLTFMSDLSINNLSLEQSYIGNIGSEFAYLMRDSVSHFVGMRISHNDIEVGELRGRYIDSGEGSIDATFSMNRLPLGLVNGFVPDRMFFLTGYANGNLTVAGALSAPQVDGELTLDSASVGSFDYGMWLRMDTLPVRIVGSNLLFEDFNLYSFNGSPLTVNGNIDFSNPDRMTLNMDMRANEYQLINSKKTPRSVAYGKAFVNFMANVSGTPNRLRMRGSLGVLGSTDLTYVLKDSPLSADDRLGELVTFTDFSDTTSVAASSAPQLGGLDMEMMINIESGARIMCALNASETNYINLEGGGSLRFVYNDIDNMQLIGRYTLSEGEMKYALPVIPLKTFTIQSGSYIEFTGDMMNPKLNIAATEQVKANVSSESGSSRTVLFDCGVKVTKTLQDMGLEFTLDAPEDMTVKNELAAMSVEQRGKAAVTMLTTGMYLADGNTSGFSMNNALNSFLQSEINNITNSAMKSIDMSVGIDQTSEASGSTRTDYSFQFAKRFWNNRFSFVIGGKVSSGSDDVTSGEDDNTFINNVSLEYRLDQTSMRYVRLFYNKDANDLLEGDITEYGAGFVWRKKMDSLWELFDFRLNKRKKSAEVVNDSTEVNGKDD